MTRLLMTLALVAAIAFGSAAAFTAPSYACGDKDKGATTEDTTGGDTGSTES